MFNWVLNMPLFPVKNKERNYLAWNTLWPLFMDGVQLSQGYRDNSLFTTQSPGVPGTHLIDIGRMKGIWIYLAATGLLDWETSTLTTKVTGKRYVKCKCPFFINIKQTLHYKVAIE